MTIQERIAAAKAALEEQEKENRDATPRPWTTAEAVRDDGETSAGVTIDHKTELGGETVLWSRPDCFRLSITNRAVICRARNLNPARLAVAREMLAKAEEIHGGAVESGRKFGGFYQLTLAERLLGIREG